MFLPHVVHLAFKSSHHFTSAMIKKHPVLHGPHLLDTWKLLVQEQASPLAYSVARSNQHVRPETDWGKVWGLGKYNCIIYIYTY